MQKRNIFKDSQFISLFSTQFLGALNDNFFKNALVVMITFKSISLWGLDHKSLVALAGGIFILPYFLFSALAGQLADRFEKTRIIRYTKIFEILVMTMAALGFYWQSFHLLIFVLFMMGTQSTFFGPVKYSILPDIITEVDLVAGNAYVEMGTFLAILIGTISGGIVSSLASSTIWLMLGVLTFAVAGYFASLKMKPVKIASPDLKISLDPFRPTIKVIRESQSNPAVYNSIFGISWFWAFGAVFLSLLPVYGKDFLRGDEWMVTTFLAVFTVGIGLGSFICEKLSKESVEIGLVPIGSLGMSLFLLDLSFIAPPTILSQGAFLDPAHSLTLWEFIVTTTGLRILVDFLALSIFGGFFTVPLYTLIQQRSSAENRSRIIAANNILNAIFMVVGSVALMGLYWAGLTLPEMFLVIAIVNTVVAFYIYSVVPEFTLRFYSWILVHILYRVQSRGLDHIPKTGPVLLCCNHVSFVDWLIIAGLVRRPTHFVIYYKFFQIPVLRWLLGQAGVIPIAGRREDEQILENSYSKIKQYLDDGKVVCIFPEGMITRDGQLNEFRPGILKMLESSPVPVVPLALKGLWGSLFSYKDGKAFKKLPRRFWHRVTLVAAPAITAQNFSLPELQTTISHLLSESN